MSARRQVVTYRLAYLPVTIDLCAEHANNADAECSLGPVEHGAHAGQCDVCVERRPYDLVVLETMPDQHRDSHRTAGNWGVYPHNGSTRSIVTREEAERAIADDADGYARIVRDATRADVEADD